MNTTEVINKLKQLDKYMKSCNLSYVVTGTAGLSIQGALPEEYDVHDINIIVPVVPVFQPKERIEAELEKAESLGNIPNKAKFAEYERKVYIFNLDGIIINAFIEENHGELRFNNIEPCETIPDIIKFQICVHKVNDILRAKFKLSRNKDYRFYNMLVGFMGTFFKH